MLYNTSYPYHCNQRVADGRMNALFIYQGNPVLKDDYKFGRNVNNYIFYTITC